VTAALGAAACVLAVLAGVGAGATYTAIIGNLQRAYPDKYKPLVLMIYVALTLVGLAGACAALGVVG
jgi:hypothetical protein